MEIQEGERVLEVAKLTWQKKQKQKRLSLPRNVTVATFGKLLVVFSTMVNLLYLLYLRDLSCCLLHLIKQNFPKNFSKNFDVDDSGTFLPAFPSRTSNLKLDNIDVTLKLVMKVITNFDLSKVSGPDCFLVVVLRRCMPELSYILAELFDMCLNESFWNVASLVTLFKNVGEKSLPKTPDLLVLFLWLIKVLKNP